VLSVDEKPSIPAIERPSGYVETDSGAVVRGLKSTYKRHGTLNLFAALEVGTGQVKTKITELRKRADFQSFLEGMIAEQPPDKEIHVILDEVLLNNKLYKTEVVGYVLCSAERWTRPGCAPNVEREDMDASSGNFERVPVPFIRSREGAAAAAGRR